MTTEKNNIPFGDKTLQEKDPYDNLSAMDKVQIRMLNNNIHKDLSSLLNDLSTKPSTDAVAKIISNNLTHFPLQDHKIEVREQTWSELYLTKTKTALAWLAHKLIKLRLLKSNYSEANLATLLFPYEEITDIAFWLENEKWNAMEFIIEGGGFSADSFIEHLVSTGSKPPTRFHLRTPIDVVVAEIMIKPIRAVDFITVDVKISNDL